jgi:hypothetical protein
MPAAIAVPLISAGIGAATSLYEGSKAAGAAKGASQQQMQALQGAQNVASGVYGQQQRNLAPWMQQGQYALGNLMQRQYGGGPGGGIGQANMNPGAAALMNVPGMGFNLGSLRQQAASPGGAQMGPTGPMGQGAGGMPPGMMGGGAQGMQQPLGMGGQPGANITPQQLGASGAPPVPGMQMIPVRMPNGQTMMLPPQQAQQAMQQGGQVMPGGGGQSPISAGMMPRM